MEEAPENGKESPHSVHANGLIDWLYICVLIILGSGKSRARSFTAKQQCVWKLFLEWHYGWYRIIKWLWPLSTTASQTNETWLSPLRMSENDDLKTSICSDKQNIN